MVLFLLQLLCLLLLARFCGVGAERLGQIAPVGELIAGILIAVAATAIVPANSILEELRTSPNLAAIANLAVFFLVLRAGVDMKPKEVFAASGDAFAVALGGILLPLALGVGLGWWFIPPSELKVAQVLVVGLALSVTAVPATARVFEEMGLLHSRLGVTVLSAALIDDIIGLMMLAAVTTLAASGGVVDFAGLAWLVAKTGVFFAVTGLLGAHVYPHVSERLRKEKVAALELSALVAVALAYALLAEALGLHWIMGAFMAGLFLEPARIGKQPFEDMQLIMAAITSGVLGPLFFITIGLQVDVIALYQAPALAALLVLAAFFGKLIGSGVPALMVGFNRRHACAVGVGMSTRGAVVLIILGVVVEAGILSPGTPDGVVTNLFSLLVVMAVATTLAAPLALRALLKADD